MKKSSIFSLCHFRCFIYMVYNGCTGTSSRGTRACMVVCIYRRSANFLVLLYHYRMWLMRRLTQPRVSCYYSPWRTGPPAPSLSLVLSHPFPFTTARAGETPFRVHTWFLGPEWVQLWRWFIHSINPGLVGAGFEYCFSNSHARRP